MEQSPLKNGKPYKYAPDAKIVMESISTKNSRSFN